MSHTESNVSTDPELTRQLETASATDDAVEAVFILSPDEPSQVVPTPERTEELTRKVLDRVKDRVGRAENKLNIFRNIGSFVVSAHPSFLRELMSQPEIASAMANHQAGAITIGPVKKRPVSSASREKAGSQERTRARSDGAKTRKIGKSK